MIAPLPASLFSCGLAASSRRPSLKVLSERIMDPEEKVRERVVTAVCEGCREQLQPFGPLLAELAKRMLDKKART